MLEDATKDVIVPAFTIFSGFIITILTFTSFIKNAKGWQKTQEEADKRRSVFAVQLLIFYLYLLMIMTIYISSLIPENIFCNIFERIYFGLSWVILLCSFKVGWDIYSIQADELDKEVMNQYDETNELDK